MTAKRLSFLFGSGVSNTATGIGWNDLMDQCLMRLVKEGKIDPDDPRSSLSGFTSNLVASSFIEERADNLGELVSGALYTTASRYMKALGRDNAPIDLVLSAQKFGYNPTVCTLNYDIFLEEYIYRKSNGGCCSVLGPEDEKENCISVWHPHGRLVRPGSKCMPELKSSDWLTFSKLSYVSRQESRTPHDEFWYGKLISFFDSSRLLVVGAGGEDDVWHREVELLNGMMPSKRFESYRGVWLLCPPKRGQRISANVLDRISMLQFIPLVFSEKAEMYEFVAGIHM